MIRLHSLLPLGIVTACLIVPAGLWAGTNDAASKAAKPAKATAPADKGKPADAATPTQAAPAPAKPKKKLTASETARRDLVRATLAMHQKLPLNTRDNSATEITSYCLAFGCGSEVLRDAADENHINGITCLCWGYPCAGFQLLGLSQGHVAARIGYGCQEHPGEFLAMLAMSRGPDELPGPRQPLYPQRGRPRRSREAELPRRRGLVAQAARPGLFPRRAAVEKRSR